MKITISEPEYQILSNSSGKFKVQMKGSDDNVVPNFHLPRHWSDLGFSGECANPDSVAYFGSINEATEFIEKLKLARTEKDKIPPVDSWKVVKKIPSRE